MYKKILMPIDMGHQSSWRKALPVAAGYMHHFGSALHIMTVVPEIHLNAEGGHLLEGHREQVLAETQEQLNLFIGEHLPKFPDVRCSVEHGTIYWEILRVAKDIAADVIIMASHRPKAMDFLLGPNAAKVVRHANCSVLVVRE